MMAVLQWVCFVLWLISLFLTKVDGLFISGVLHCQFSDRNGSDALYLEKFYFNKMLIVMYSSATFTYTGYTEYTKRFTEMANKNPVFMERQRRNSNGNCLSQVPALYDMLQVTVPPNIRLSLESSASSNHSGQLVCSVHNFYPKDIRVTWLRNGQEVTSHVSFTEVLPEGNWLYAIHAYLEYTPMFGEKITCKVEHASLRKAMLKDWEHSGSQNLKIGVGIAVLLSGLMVLIAGIICYMRNTSDRQVQMPLSEASSTGEQTPANPQ